MGEVYYRVGEHLEQRKQSVLMAQGKNRIMECFCMRREPTFHLHVFPSTHPNMLHKVGANMCLRLGYINFNLFLADSSSQEKKRKDISSGLPFYQSLLNISYVSSTVKQKTNSFTALSWTFTIKIVIARISKT